MVLVDVGEDEIFYIEDGKYAVNVEKVILLFVDVEVLFFDIYEKLEIFGIEIIEKMCEFFYCFVINIVKNVLY